MPEKIVHNLTTWRDEIELALVFWFIGATIGVGQHLLSPDPPLAQMGIAAGIASLGTAALEMAFLRFVIGRKTPDA